MQDELEGGWQRLLSSWSDELLATTERIQHLIGNRHQPTKGGYKEALLRRLLRRVLPERFRVSTGFIFRWNGKPSQQIDVMIWDASKHSALLEEGELAVLTANAVDAIVEVKSSITKSRFRESLELLNPEWLTTWRYTTESSQSGLKQDIPASTPFRGVFAFTGGKRSADSLTQMVFEEIANFYGQRFGADAERAIGHVNGNNLNSVNMIDAVCVANAISIEQASLWLDFENLKKSHFQGYVAFKNQSHTINTAVGRFCMLLLRHLTGWENSEQVRYTLSVPALTANPGVCCLPEVPESLNRIRAWGREMPLDSIWHPKKPLWVATLQERPN